MNVLRVLLFGCVGNFLMFGVELAWGIWSGSNALIADSLHLASDAVAWGIAGWAEWFSRRGASERYTFGREKAHAFVAVLSVCLLAFVVVRDIIPEAVGRFSAPHPVLSTPMLVVAIIGGLWNLLLRVLLPGVGRAHHVRSARLHVDFDLLSSAVVVAAALAIKASGWLWWDSAGSLAIAALIGIPASSTFRAAMDELLDKAPPFPWEAFQRVMRSLPGVLDFHEVHLRQVGEHTSMTLHVIRDPGVPQEDIDRRLEEIFHGWFKVGHHTVRTEVTDCGEMCVFLPPAPTR